MIIKDIEFTLKDGRHAIIRSPKDEDIQGMLVQDKLTGDYNEFKR